MDIRSYNNGYDLDWSDLSDKQVAKVYEITDKSWLPNNGVGLTFADLAGDTVKAPSVAELTVGWPGTRHGCSRASWAATLPTASTGSSVTR